MIDCHTHMPGGDGWLSGTAFSAEDMLGFMDRHHVTAAVVMTLDGLAHPSPQDNDRVAAFVAGHTDRLLPFATVDPRRRDAADEVRRCVESNGMRGVKLHPWLQGFCVHEPYMDPLCETAAELGIPIVFHDGTPPYSMALQIAALARRHPATSLVLGHGGLHDTWREALTALQTTDNVWACLSGTPPYAARRIIHDGPLDRIVVGTDAGLSAVADQPYAALRMRELEQWGLTETERLAVFDVNATRLLNLA